MSKPKILATICARGGSKGVKGKNYRLLNGKPLIYYTIENVLQSSMIDEFVISTDSEQIIELVREKGITVDYKRPDELAMDDTPKAKAIRHATEFVETARNFKPDYVVDLDVTCPLKTVGDIDNTLRQLVDHPEYDCIVTVYEPERNPYFNMVEKKEHGFYNLVKVPDPPVFSRQKAPKVYSISPAVVAWKREALNHVLHFYEGKWGIYEMPVERARDIDTEFDFKLIEFLLTNDE